MYKLTTLQKIDRFIMDMFPVSIGHKLACFVERRRNLPSYPESYASMTEEESHANSDRRIAAEDAMPWFWRELYFTGCNLRSIQINIENLCRLDYWWNLYLPNPRFLIGTLVETTFLAFFGNIYGPIYKGRLQRWLRFRGTN